MTTDGDRIAELESRVEALAYALVVVIGQIAEDPLTPRPANGRAGARFVRTASAPEIHHDVANILERAGLGDLPFEVR